MKNVLQTILSQYATGPVLVPLVERMNDSLDPRVNLDMFYNQVMNVKTAVGYGLDVWGRIVGVSRYVNLSAADAFGFTTGFKPFGEAPFFAGFSSTNNFALPDDQFRQLILVKAIANISDCSAPSLNRLIHLLFPGRGAAYVVDSGNMSMIYRFGFSLTDVEIAILFQSGAIPHPAGVSVSFDINSQHYVAPGYVDPTYVY